jgi:CrcB protein
MSLLACVLVVLGAFCGGIARFLISGFVARRIGETFPWGTLVVNISGALTIGSLAGLVRASSGIVAGELLRDFLFVGFCGGYTTVSSFCFQTLNLSFDGEQRRAVLNVLLSSALCVLAVAIGFWSVAIMLR